VSNGQNCQPGDAHIDLNVNNINARLANDGDLWDYSDGESYVTSSSDNLYAPTIGIGGLWIGGVDSEGTLKVAATVYNTGNDTDYYPGPLMDESGETTAGSCINWDRFWVINRDEVDAHLDDFGDGNIDFQIENIYSWPGRNNPHFEAISGFTIPINQELAPFHDADQDGDYNPDQGDYPIMKGDQSIWWVYNDNGGIHGVTSGESIKIEVQVMAYAYANVNNEDLNNTTFYDYRLTNKSQDVFRNGFVGLWMDADVGCPANNYTGYDDASQMMYVYTSEIPEESNCPGGPVDYEGKLPVYGIKKLDGDIHPVTSFMTMNRGISDPDPATSNPIFDGEYYNYLQGRWRDGTPLTYGGTGFDPESTDTVKFAFSEAPSDENGWSMCAAELPFEDRNTVMSSAMPDLQPGESTTASYAVIFVEDVAHPCPSLDRLKEAADSVVDVVSSAEEIAVPKVNFTISPNPATDRITIKGDRIIQFINVIDINGRTVLNYIGTDKNTAQIDVSQLSSGIYIVNIVDGGGSISAEKFVKR